MQSLGSGLLEFLAIVLAFLGSAFVGAKIFERSALARSGTNLDVVVFLAFGVAGALVTGWIWETVF